MEASMSRGKVVGYEVVGIDVGAKKLVAAAGKVRVAAEYANTPAGRGRLIARLRTAKGPVRAVLEATGIYFLDLACELVEAGIAVMVINPKAAHHFAEALLQRRKDDPVDAAMLREYGERMAFAPWMPPGKALFQLRALGRQAGGLGKAIAAAKNELHAAQATALASPVGVAVLTRRIAHDEALIEELLAEARRLAAADPVLERRLELADSIPGVAEKSAILLLGELALLPAAMSARQWTAQAGLDVREERSGTSLNRRPRISRRGNKRLREALFHPAMAAVRCCPQARAFADRLIGRGLTPMQAIVAVMRKLLHALHALWRRNETFDADKLFAAACAPP
jgi:transposase